MALRLSLALNLLKGTLSAIGAVINFKLVLEDNSSRILLEDNTSVLELE